MPIISGGAGGGGAISGVTVTGAGAAGKVPVASSAAAGTWAFPPGFEIGYDQITASVTVVSTTEATGTTIIACGAHTFDGAPVIAEFYSPGISIAGTAGEFVAVSLFEGATQITELATAEQPASVSSIIFPVTARLRFTPTAASHTYTVTAFKSAAGVASVGAGVAGTGANPPAFVRFTKV